MAGYRMKAGQQDSSELPEVPADWSLLLGPDMEAVLVTWSRQIFCVSQIRREGGLYLAVVFFVALSVFWEGTIQNSAVAVFLSGPEISAPNFRQVFSLFLLSHLSLSGTPVIQTLDLLQWSSVFSVLPYHPSLFLSVFLCFMCRFASFRVWW